jgi:large subunit ribosomal protein L25
MASRIAMNGQPRTGQVKPRELRRQQRVPAIMYGHGFPSRKLQFDYLSAVRVIREAGTSRLVELDIDGEDESHTVLIREVQRDPVSDVIIHLDLYRLVEGVAITTEVPVVQRGEAPVVESMGGIVNQLLDSIEIEVLPKDMPESISFDASALVDFDSFLTVGDLQIPEGVRVMVPDDTEVVRVVTPRSEEELEAAMAVEELPEEAVEAEAEAELEPAQAEEEAAEAAGEEEGPES